ncbi:heterokaryon incompatibility protein-domain-containing protein [Xylaria curta]|nr:heterokaryon incompatibility protein-domain-containing protein [Xylaria curta]
MDASSSYSYTPLKATNEVRLMNLLPGRDSSPISVEIFHVMLDSSPQYEALSYAWGLKDDAYHALAGSAKIAISTNLHEALQHLRSTEHKRTLWIDALCIDQNNDKERSQQISLMRDIYRTASQVVIWLGAKSSSSDCALKFLEYLSKMKERKIYRWTEIGLKQRDEEDWEALDELLARPWWSRAWVLQEAWSATDAILQCGQSIISWDIIKRASLQLAKLDDPLLSRRERGLHRDKISWVDATTPLLERLVLGLLYVNGQRLCLWESNKRRYGLALHLVYGKPERSYHSTFSDLLWNTWDRQAADPRDKVYSLIGVAEGELSPMIIPDYSKPMEQVYKEVARSIIMTEKHLDMLLAANGVAGSDLLPSWVPDWRTEANDFRPTLLVNGSRMFTLFHFSSLTIVDDSHHCLFSASGGSKATFEFDSTLDTLTVSAVIFDKIADMTHTFRTSETRRFWDKRATYFHNPTDTSLQQFHEDVSSAYMLAARSRGVLPNNQARVVDASLEKDVDEVLMAGYTRDFNGRWGDECEYKYMYYVAANIMRQRRFFVTEAGHFAIGANVAQPGDYLCVIVGCNYPMILRRDDRNDGFRLVADAYVGGAMEGEVLSPGSPWPSSSSSDMSQQPIEPTQWQRIMIR